MLVVSFIHPPPPCMSPASSNFLLLTFKHNLPLKHSFLTLFEHFFCQVTWTFSSRSLYFSLLTLFFSTPRSCLLTFQSLDRSLQASVDLSLPCIHPCPPWSLSGFWHCALSSLPHQSALLPWRLGHFISSCIHSLIQQFLCAFMCWMRDWVSQGSSSRNVHIQQ